MLQTLGQLDAALDSEQRAIIYKPDFAEAHNNLGITLQELGQFDNAAASFSRAMELKRDYTEAHYNLGNILKLQGKIEASAACFKLCLKIDPNDRLGARILLAALNIEPIPLRASEAHLEAFYNKKAALWDKNLNSTRKYFGAESGCTSA